MKVLFVISSMAAGGAERAVAHMANYWAAKGWHTSIATLAPDPPFYPLHPDVRILPLNEAGESTSTRMALAQNAHRLRAIRRTVTATAPDVVISVMDRTNVRTLLALRGVRTPVIVQEQIDPASHSIGRQWERLRRITYPWADAIVVLTSRNADYFPPSLRSRVRVIPNPAVLSTQPDPKARDRRAGNTVVAMGRCVPQKGFDLLLRAFAQVSDRYPLWKLKILGDGAQRAELEQMAGDLGLSEKVLFMGIVKEPIPVLESADIFAFSSRYEGFPLALCEAMACGLPVVSFDCPSGPREIIRDGIDGLLVPPEDVDAFAQAMLRLMADPALREQLGARAVEVTDRFGLERIMAQWETLLSEVTGAPGENKALQS